MAYYKFMSFDKSGEPTSFKIHLLDIDGTNFEAHAGAILNDGIALVEGLSLLEWKDVDLVSEVHTGSGQNPTNPYAQRELKARFDFVDPQGRKGSLSVPAPDMDDVAQPGTDAINLADAEVAAYVNALEIWAVSRFGEPISVVGGEIVGRNI